MYDCSARISLGCFTEKTLGYVGKETYIMNKRLKKGLIITLIGFVALVLISGIGFYIWTQQIYEPVEDINASVEGASEEGDWLVFSPEHSAHDTGLILYPGARVDPASYSYLASLLADEGLTVAIPSVRLNLALLDSNKADEFINESDIDSWYIGGHSLGGVAAAMYADQSPEQVSGLLFLASYPAADLSDQSFPVLSIFAENDGLTSEEDIQESASSLPDQTTFSEIAGGNHAQFGMYGPQSGDNDATIPALEQQHAIADSILKWVNTNDNE